MSGLAVEHDAINLGQGFPDNEGPDDVRAKAADALMHGSNQYPPMLGLPELRQAVARHYGRFHGVELDWRTQVLVTSGATEALAAAIMALVAPGDEAVLLEPAYDSYAPQVRAVGGVPRFVRLEPPLWRISREALESVTPNKTRLIVFNNPQNPAARVYAPDELQLLADWCQAHDVIAVCDEVWEHLVFDGRRHTPLNLQTGVAYGLGKDDSYFLEMRAYYARSRDRLTDGLKAEGFAVIPSEGTYFLNVDIAASGLNIDDAEFCLRAVKEAGVAAIPVSAFYESDPVSY